MALITASIMDITVYNEAFEAAGKGLSQTTPLHPLWGLLVCLGRDGLFCKALIKIKVKEE